MKELEAEQVTTTRGANIEVKTCPECLAKANKEGYKTRAKLDLPLMDSQGNK